MSDTSEEKSLPASDKKIRDARDKGQVVKSKDLVTGVALLATSLYVASMAAGQRDRIEALFILLGRRAHGEAFDQVWPMALTGVRQLLLTVSLPLLVITLAAVILTNIGTMRGFIFSVTPITPNFKHINPAEGVKRLYSLRSIVEFVKALVKIGALAAAFVIVFRLHLQDLMLLSVCTTSCQFAIFVAMARPLMATALVAFILVGLADLLLQHWLFQRDMRMTHNEAKRERRDAEGDPTILRQRKRQRDEMHGHSGRKALNRPTLIIGSPGRWCVGVRYVRGETPVPVIVWRTPPDMAADAIGRARDEGIAIARNDDLSEMLARVGRSGEAIPRHLYQRVAGMLVAKGLI
ncbi:MULTISPECIES: EscU/YscU/HrcU family type III secretion system export apparatus switch protein [unclassified Sphingobium]|uniref:EscU/YscU/HrcU family type III secretion system export apparatus switch protein n=1 Tax=unclassified Sphingobium TaxID=2611147 RepID=UPI0035A7122F